MKNYQPRVSFADATIKYVFTRFAYTHYPIFLHILHNVIHFFWVAYVPLPEFYYK